MFFPVTYYAQNIQTGNASAQSTVQTNVSGNGNVSTHIETTVNGQTNVVDSNKPGTIKVEDNNGKVKVYQSTENLYPTTVATIASIIKPVKPTTKNVSSNFWIRFVNFLTTIFKNL